MMMPVVIGILAFIRQHIKQDLFRLVQPIDLIRG
jgi:hypothetical protein